jgi:hypothetical protein
MRFAVEADAPPEAGPSPFATVVWTFRRAETPGTTSLPYADRTRKIGRKRTEYEGSSSMSTIPERKRFEDWGARDVLDLSAEALKGRPLTRCLGATSGNAQGSLQGRSC